MEMFSSMETHLSLKSPEFANLVLIRNAVKWVLLVSYFTDKHPELTSLAHSHMACQWRSSDSNSRESGSRAHTLTAA